MVARDSSAISFDGAEITYMFSEHSSTIDTSVLSVSHSGQSAVHGALNRKSRRTRRDLRTVKQVQQQHNVNSAGTSLLMALKREGLVIDALIGAVRGTMPREVYRNCLFPVSHA